MSGADGGFDYEQFRQTFFEECTEILGELEGRLTRSRSEALDSEGLNAVFRAAHSIKAGAGAFGYTELVKFTHVFEALLDQLRSGRMEQTERVAGVLIRAGDVVAALVACAQERRAVPPGYGAEVAAELEGLLSGKSGPTAATAAPVAAAGQGTPTGDTGARVYRIRFRPFASLYANANEPLLLIRELKRLGTLTVACQSDAIVPLDTVQPEGAYLAWEMRLATAKPKSDIAEIFEFVDGDCELIIEPIVEDQITHANASAPVAALEPVSTGAAMPADPIAAVPLGEMAPAAPVSGRPVEAASTAAAASPGKPATTSIRVDLGRVDRLVNIVGELVIAQAMIAQQIADLTAASGRAGSVHGHEDLAALTRELQDCVMAIRMQPVKSVFQRMPRLVRELSAKLGKEVRLVTSGEQTEVDKTVVEELADPLTHMIRNSLDHGIEDTETRRATGKSAEGTIELAAAHVGSNILITVSDDGRGLDRQRIYQKAVEKGVVAAGSQLSDEEIDDLIFAPGFSTAAQVTDVSGRGVGMDVVRRNIQNLGGRIQVGNAPGRGTRFTLVIPLTLAVLDGMVVKVGRERYILPLTSIVESFRPQRGKVQGLLGRGEVMINRGQVIRLLHLSRVFDVTDAVEDASHGLVVIVETANGNKIGLVVDELIGQQQVVIKSLSDNFVPIAGVSGATILGNGRVAMILDIEELMHLSERPPKSARPPADPIPVETARAPARAFAATA